MFVFNDGDAGQECSAKEHAMEVTRVRSQLAERSCQVSQVKPIFARLGQVAELKKR